MTFETDSLIIVWSREGRRALTEIRHQSLWRNNPEQHNCVNGASLTPLCGVHGRHGHFSDSPEVK